MNKVFVAQTLRDNVLLRASGVFMVFIAICASKCHDSPASIQLCTCITATIFPKNRTEVAMVESHNSLLNCLHFGMRPTLPTCRLYHARRRQRKPQIHERSPSRARNLRQFRCTELVRFCRADAPQAPRKPLIEIPWRPAYRAATPARAFVRDACQSPLPRTTLALCPRKYFGSPIV